MKVLFAIIVLIASAYLILPKDALNKLTLFLPQNQIEKAAETVLSDVDKKLEQFKIELSSKKDIRIKKLEDQLTTLKTQFIAQEKKFYLAEIQRNEQVLQQFPVEKTPAKNQYAAAEALTTHPKQPLTDNIDNVIEETDKQRTIKRQAYLQDLVDRMNKTSLLTLTN
ncbi:MAG: hypothetical protein MJK15_06030 [Colwellia sp.]|nr:hypothetical protein [Colwellia sp.]